MSRVVIGSLLFLSLCLPAAGREEVIRNASFEDPVSPDTWTDDMAAHWGRWGNWINRETGWSPTRSGVCLIGYHHWQIEEVESSGIYHDIVSAPAARHYTFSVYAFKDPETNVKEIELRLEAPDGLDVIASESYTMDEIAHGAWKRLSVSGTNARQGLRLTIVVTPRDGSDRKGTVKFDDATLKSERMMKLEDDGGPDVLGLFH